LHTVKITDESHPYFGQELPGNCFYYDIFHRGTGGPDLFVIETPEGQQTILSTKVDTDHYWKQRRQQEIERLGADVGDTVLIKSGGAGNKRDFDWRIPHVITQIDAYGNVEWDDGAAWGFRPDVTMIEKAHK
jgi:hypothetical protein